MRDAVEEVLEMMQPAIAQHAGAVELVDVDEQSGVVQVRFQGACVGCSMSHVTLHNGIERILKERVPGVTAVQAV